MVTWQIVSGLGQAQSFRGGASYPYPFSYFVNAIEVFMLDFFSFLHSECVARTTYDEKLMVSLLTVVTLGLIAVSIGQAGALIWGGSVIRSSSVKSYIGLMVFALPGMTSMAFRAFSVDRVSKYHH